MTAGCGLAVPGVLSQQLVPAAHCCCHKATLPEGHSDAQLQHSRRQCPPPQCFALVTTSPRLLLPSVLQPSLLLPPTTVLPVPWPWSQLLLSPPCRRREAHAARNAALMTEITRQRHAFALALRDVVATSVHEAGGEVVLGGLAGQGAGLQTSCWLQHAQSASDGVRQKTPIGGW